MNLRESVWKDLFISVMKIILQEKEWIHWNTTILCTNLFLCFKQWKYQMQQQQWLKNEKNSKNTSMAADKITETKRRWSLKQGMRAKPYTLRRWSTYVISRIRSWSHSFEKYKVVELYPEVTLFRIVCSIFWAGIIGVTSDCCKSNGYYFKTTRMRRRMRRTSSRRSIFLHPGQNGRCTDVIENSKIGMSRYLDTSTETQMALIIVQYGRFSRSFSAKSVWSSFDRTIMWKAIQESSFGTRLGEGSKLGMSLCTSRKRTILIRVCGWHQIGWKETKHWPNVESTRERSWFGRTNNIPWPCLFGLHSTRMTNKQRYCGQQKYVWIQNRSWSYRKATLFRETWREHFLMVLWHGRSFKEVRGKILRNRRTKQLNSYTKSQHHTLTTTNSTKKKWDLSENWQRFARKIVFIMLIFGAYW